jgi:nucleoporin GLE1
MYLSTRNAKSFVTVALDVIGKDAKAIWGYQFVKLLALIYEGTTSGLGNGKLIGGASPEGIAARGRVQLEIEAIMKES